MSQYLTKLEQAENEFQNNLELAKSLAFQVYQSEPQNLKALELLYLAASREGDTDNLLKFLLASAMVPSCPSATLYELGSTLLALGKGAESIHYLLRALSGDPNSFPILHDLGAALASVGNLNEGLTYLERAAKLEGTSCELFFNIGRIYDANFDYKNALEFYKKSLSLKNDFIPAIINKGIAHYELKEFNLALLSYEAALKIAPDMWEIWLNLGNLFQHTEQLIKSISAYDKALALSPQNSEVLASKSDVYQRLRRYQDAISSMEEALIVNPHFAYLPGALLHSKMCICDWADFQNAKTQLCNAVVLGERASPPFPLLAITDDERIHLKASQTWSIDRMPSPLPALRPWPKKSKIRLAYYSADFHQHATAILILDLFKFHDAENFELCLFSYGPNTQDSLQQSIASLAFQFIDAREMSDDDIVNLSHELKIDIAIDLKGYTEKSRASIFSKRAAPVQISFLGYPGTLGTTFFDYIVADSQLIPVEQQRFYTEKIIYLPSSYQINSDTRTLSLKQFSRLDFKLPENGFVFCSFNHNYKITPEIFAIWMSILNNTENSVLWLLADNAIAASNLSAEAQRLGINSDRLIFTQRLSLPEHLSRHKLADLFLDTTPCNAHTTASDALWAGLPVLTCVGQSFASRVSSSLLTALNLPELVCTNIADYEQKAISLAQNPAAIGGLKSKLSESIKSSSLFNSQEFTKNIEAAFQQVYEISLNGREVKNLHPIDYLESHPLKT